MHMSLNEYAACLRWCGSFRGEALGLCRLKWETPPGVLDSPLLLNMLVSQSSVAESETLELHRI